MSRSFLLFLLRGMGTGYTPGIPGTVGSLLALLLSLPFWPPNAIAGRTGTFLLLLSLSFGTAFITWIGFRSFHEEWEEFDPSDIVLDEFAGTFLVIGLLSLLGNWHWMLAGFVLFRFLDMLKPYPIHLIEKQDRFAGLVIDDLAAGVLAALSISVVWILFHSPFI